MTGHTLTSEDSRRGAEASNLVQAEQRHELHKAAHQTYQLVTALETGEIGHTAYKTALHVIEAIATRAESGLPLDESIDIYRAAQVAETIFKIHRLATNQSTANTAHATIDEAAVEARMVEARARLGQLGNDTTSGV